MEYDAITLDTNIFRHNGWHLEGGMLGQLVQFKEGLVQFVLSEVVLREIHKYLKLEAKDARDSVERAGRESRKNGLFSPEVAEQIDALFSTARSAEDAAKSRLQAFADATGMTVVPAEQADIKELVRRYFTPSAPFETSGKKKNEFPDAIALLSIENWAQAEGKRILAVSNDDGWADYAQSSKSIDVETDLAKALGILQKHAEDAEAFVGMLLAKMAEGECPDLLQEITDAMSNAVGELDVYPEASSAYHFEAESVTLSFEDFQFSSWDNEYDFTIVQIGKDKIVVRTRVTIQAKAECDFALAIWDSIDKEYVSMGSASAETEVEFDAAALITFEGDFATSEDEIEMSSLELVEAIDSIDFGEVEIDYGEDRYDDEIE